MRTSDLLKRRAELVERLVEATGESIDALGMTFLSDDDREDDLCKRFTKILASRWQT